MGSAANIKLVVLWEDEIRLAARAIMKLADGSQKDRPLEEIRSLVVAIYYALAGADDPTATLAICTKPKPRRKGKLDAAKTD